MVTPNFEVADEINKDLTQFEDMWFLLEEFNDGLQELAKEDWISFRSVFIKHEIYATVFYYIKNLTNSHKCALCNTKFS